jgi:hypothetical protein
MGPDDERAGKWWRRTARTRRHIYYAPTTNLPGKLLFALIFVLGALALAVAARQAISHHGLDSQNMALGGVGLFCVLLAISQIRQLSR